ncbi:nitrite reductase small subunit NirD [Arthrobacter sp. NPDC089319]|uniref:nitrite reductase small subunit NirD n=1 Tax=Arthrobacter sp. NPDC089319 TaxID=3155915 RepID=UPI00341B7103
MTAPETSFDHTDTAWHRICSMSDLECGWGEAAWVAGRQIAIVKVSDEAVYAVDQQCPATGAFVMARGIVGNRGSAATIASPLHKEVYLLETGECPADPDLYLSTYPVRIEDGVVLVELDDAQIEAAA